MRKKLSMLVNLLAAALALYAWISMVFHAGRNGRLSSAGLASLKYFTVLSNLMQAGASIAWVAVALRRGEPSRGLRRLKYAAAVSVALTFFTVLLFLGRVYGYPEMYVGANLWFHLIVPLLAMLDFMALDRSGPVPAGDMPFAALPMLFYGAGYVANLLINGVKGNDWYGFAVGGEGGSAVVFAIMVAGTLLIAALLRLPRRGR